MKGVHETALQMAKQGQHNRGTAGIFMRLVVHDLVASHMKQGMVKEYFKMTDQCKPAAAETDVLIMPCSGHSDRSLEAL